MHRSWRRSSTELARLVAVFALVAGTATAALADAPTPKARAEQVLARRDYQTELPGDPARTRPIRFGALDPNFTRLIGGLALVAAVVAAGALLFALLRRRSDVSRPPPVAKAPVATLATSSRLDESEARGPTLADADLLAHAGDYRGAVHALLLVAIDVSARRTAASFPPSTTARELTRVLPLDANGRDGFRVLVGAVERSVFAGRDVRLDDYAACRAQCLLLAGGPAV